MKNDDSLELILTTVRRSILLIPEISSDCRYDFFERLHRLNTRVCFRMSA